MEREVELGILGELLRQLDEGRNVDAGVMYRNPTASYTCPDVAQREQEILFRDHPQLIALSGSLPEPGSYLTVEDFGVPVLATRDSSGRFRAFVNACRHRGARVAEGAGKSAAFMCPFHNWVYSNEGELTGIPRQDHVGAIDKKCHGLIELPAVEEGGLLWVHPRADGRIDLDQQLGSLGAEIASWGFGEFIHKGETVIEGRLNWKLANDTFGETYHFSRLHKNTLGQLFHGDALSYEEFGRNHRFVIATKMIDALRTRPRDEWSLRETTNPLYYLFPNIQLSFAAGTVNVIKMYPHPEHPDDPSRSLTRVLHYFTQELIDQVEQASADELRKAENPYERDGETMPIPTLSGLTEIFATTIEQEDYLMGAHQQRTAESGQVDHLIFWRNEPALHHYHTHFRDALGMEPLERIDP